MKEETIGISMLTLLVGLLIGNYFHSIKPVEKETQYVLQECKDSAIDVARFAIERDKSIKEMCPNGGKLMSNDAGGYFVQCYEE